MEKLDVFIKHEGYADIKFLTKKAKDWAVKHSYPNGLAEFAKEGFCGKPVFVSDVQDGMYQLGIDARSVKRVTKQMQAAGLVVESEFYRN